MDRSTTTPWPFYSMHGAGDRRLALVDGLELMLKK
jgi:hypothetical protein